MAQLWMKFYPSDWRAEPKLKLISRAARSLWIDMLGLMFEAGTGRLEIEGRPMTEKELATTLGDNPRTIKKLLAEIEEMGVSSRDDDGFIVSRRIIRDFEKAERDKSNGRKGGNPALKTRGKRQEGVNPEDKAQKPDTRSQKSSVTNVTGDPPEDTPPDPVKILFDSGAALLAQGGMKPKQARSMIGKWRKSHSDEAILLALSRAKREGAIVPHEFIEKALRATGPPQSDWHGAFGKIPERN